MIAWAPMWQTLLNTKSNAFVRNTGHFDNKIDLAGSEGLGHQSSEHQASIVRFVFPLATV